MPSVFLGDFPEPDRTEDAPHPRETRHLFGQDLAEAEFLAAYKMGRAHHAWLISGPRGIGKATLAWRLARFLLATPEDDGGMFAPAPPDSLDIAADHPVSRRMLALSEPRLYLLRRGLNDKETAPAQNILVGELRKMKAYFNLSVADGGRRVAIIDAADDLNPNAANALLKLLEEPPAGVTFLLVAHQPHRLLATLRSRCRVLRLAPLPPAPLAAALAQAGADLDPAAATALAELAGGSVGEGFRLANLDGLTLYAALVGLLAGLPRLDRARAQTIADGAAGKANAAQFDLTVTLLDLLLARLARGGALGGALGAALPEAAPGEAALIARLSPNPDAGRHWADLAQSLGIRARRGKAVNLDPAALLMDMVLKIDETAGQRAQR